MRRTKIEKHLTVQELKKNMSVSKTVLQFQHWQAIYILSTKEYRVEEVSEIIGISKGTIHQWVHLYNHNGPEALKLKGRGGRRSSYLSWEEEELLLEEMIQKAQKGEVIIVQPIRKYVEEKLRRKVSKDYTYDLLHRHGWRKILPRPQHPKMDKSKQEEFKKNFQTLWIPPQKASLKMIKGH